MQQHTRPIISNGGLDSATAAFALLDSKDIKAVDEFVASLKPLSKEPWVIENLIAHYLSAESHRAVDLIVSAHTMHDKIIFKKIHTALEQTSTRFVALKLLLHIVCKKPPWLHGIVRSPLISDLCRLMKAEKTVQILSKATYIITLLLPAIPDEMVKHFDEIFDALMRLISFTYYNKDNIAVEYILHLNVGIQALFERMYGMYPWHFLSALKEFYTKNSNQLEFYVKAIEPMLKRIKLNPSLITMSKEMEAKGEKFRKKETHDIVADCESLTLSDLDINRDYQVEVGLSNVNVLKPNRDSTVIRSNAPIPLPIELAKDSLISTIVNSSNFFSPSDRLGLSTPPPVEPSTPGVTTSNPFSFGLPSSTLETATHLPNVSMKTPHNTDHNSPAIYTPKPTPTTPLEDSTIINPRSRHTSGNKGSISRVGYEDCMPSSPLRKEFTSEPPLDVLKISSVVPDNKMAGDLLSVNNLSDFLEKISDAGSVNESSDDEEVSSIINPPDITAKSMAEFRKNVNRIRFNSITVTKSENLTYIKMARRPGSCPTLSEINIESAEEALPPYRRYDSMQTKSATDLIAGEYLVNNSEKNIQPKKKNLSGSTIQNDIQLLTKHSVKSITKESYSGPSATLDTYLCKLTDRVRLAAAVHRTLEDHDQIWSSSAEPTVEGLKGVIALLHDALLFERCRRELHIKRNRHHLSKIAAAEKAKEENLILKDKLSSYENELFQLKTTCRLLSAELKNLRDGKARNDSKLEEELTTIIKDNEKINFAKNELQRVLDSKNNELVTQKRLLDESFDKSNRLEQDLLMAAEELRKYREYEDEVSRMKRELLLMGEIQVKYEETLSSLKYNNDLSLMPQQEDDYIRQIDDLKLKDSQNSDLLTRKQREIEDLCSKLKEKDVMVKGLNDMMSQLRGEYSCKLESVEDKYKMSQITCQALETQMMSLYDQLGRNITPPSRSFLKPGFAGPV